MTPYDHKKGINSPLYELEKIGHTYRRRQLNKFSVLKIRMSLQVVRP